MWVYNNELCLQDSIWRQERTKHNYQYRHIGVLLACLHLVWRCCVARRKERIHSCSPCCLTEIFLALESASSLFAAIPPGFGSTASLSGIPLTHCLGPAPHVYTWQHVSLLCWMGSCCCCLSKRRGRAGAVGQEFPPSTTHHLSQVETALLWSKHTETHEISQTWMFSRLWPTQWLLYKQVANTLAFRSMQ